MTLLTARCDAPYEKLNIFAKESGQGVSYVRVFFRV
jgi:hypothetical protein